jgi:hypothetical protein
MAFSALCMIDVKRGGYFWPDKEQLGTNNYGTMDLENAIQL